MTDKEMIDYLESKGYTVLEENEFDGWYEDEITAWYFRDNPDSIFYHPDED